MPSNILKTAICLFAALFVVDLTALSREQADQESADVVIRNFKGTLKRVNPVGGFIIDFLDGDADLKANGPISIGHASGRINAETSAGDIRIKEAKGNITAVTRAGNIIIEKAEQYVFAAADWGEITIHSAQSVEIQNSGGGDVSLLNVAKGAKVMTRGNVLIVMDEKASILEPCNVSTTDGDITLYLREDYSAELSIQTPMSGNPKRESRIESDFSFSTFKQMCDEANIITISTKINPGSAPSGGKINLYIEKGNLFIKALNPGRKIPDFKEVRK